MDVRAKREKIESIDSEVKTLHPLLHEILSQIPGNDYVEYTHGPNEKGADFVVQRIDKSLRDSHYVGVVAKADRILQNFSDVERQIKECAHPRLIRQGREEVRLQEVWVITSKSISHNAKEKIHEEFATRTIRFFDSDWIADQVDQHARHFWEELASSISSYLSGVDKRLAIIAQQSIVVNGLDPKICIDLDVEEIESDKYLRHGGKQKTRLVNFVEEVKTNKISILQAEMGFGKSHLARLVVGHFAEAKTFKSTGIIPIYTPFKHYFDSDGDIGTLIQHQLGAACLKAVSDQNSTFLIVLDGVDEATADAEACSRAIQNLIAQIRSMPNARLLLTSRPIKAIDELDASSNSCQRFRIRPVSIGKIIAYLEKVFAAQRAPNKLLEDLGKSELFRQLPQNPLAAALLGNLISQKKYELPSNLTELYAKTLELMMGRWDERKNNGATEKIYKTTERLARFLARHMIDNQLVYMSRGEIEEMFRRFLDDRNIGVPYAEVVDYLMNRSGIFGEFKDTDAVFFRHRSFAEYLYAKDAYEARNLPIDSRAFHPYWHNCFYFFMGSLLEGPGEIAKLVSSPPSTDSERFYKILNIGPYLMAAYQTPYQVIEGALESVLVDAARLYLDTRDGRALSTFNALSEMQLLWIFCSLVRFHYGYEFFRKGLPITMLKIDESNLLSSEEKVYALFFAASALADCDDDSGFKYIVSEKKPSELPVPVSIALRAEVRNRPFVSAKQFKAFDKQLGKLLRPKEEDRLKFGAHFDALFKEPLVSRQASKARRLGKPTLKA